jgi:hypothetical protein
MFDFFWFQARVSGGDRSFSVNLIPTDTWVEREFRLKVDPGIRVEYGIPGSPNRHYRSIFLSQLKHAEPKGSVVESKLAEHRHAPQADARIPGWIRFLRRQLDTTLGCQLDAAPGCRLDTSALA